MPSPFLHMALPAACLFVARDSLVSLSKKQWGWLLVWTFVLGASADWDTIPGLLFPQSWLEFHRYWGHNVFSALFWVGIGSWALTRLPFSFKQALVLATSIVFSHHLLDSMSFNSHGFVGVPLLYPFSKVAFHLPIPAFESVSLDPDANPIIAHAIAGNYWTKIIFDEIFHGSLMFLMWVGLYRLVLRKRRLSLKTAPVPDLH